MTALRYRKSQRVLKSREYLDIYRSSQRGGSACFIYHVLAKSPEVSRLGVTVSKKVSKNATDRNRIKRQVKEFYRLRQEQLRIGALVITAKPACFSANDKQRLESLEQVWQKVLKWQAWHLAQHTSK